MVVYLDIYRAAKIFVKKYGADLAPFMARRRADAMLKFGDTNRRPSGMPSYAREICA